MLTKSLISIDRPYKDKIEIAENICIRVKDLLRDKHRLDFNAIYQRGLVWTLAQKRAYILNLFNGIAKITPTIIDEIRDNQDESVLEVLDGKQRLTTLFEFIDNEFSLKIDGEKVYFNDLLDKDKNFILRYDIRYTRVMNKKNIMKPVPLEYKLMLFLEINSLGTKATDEDINKVKNLLKDELS